MNVLLPLALGPSSSHNPALADRQVNLIQRIDGTKALGQISALQQIVHMLHSFTVSVRIDRISLFSNPRSDIPFRNIRTCS